MCGRFLLFTCEDYEELLSIIRDVEINNPTSIIYGYPKIEIRPGATVPIVRKPIGESAQIHLSKWGFPDLGNKGRLLINARSETLEQKQTFRGLIHSKRCLVPTLGFYEWNSCDGSKDKYLIRPQTHSFFYMAGLFNDFRDPSGNSYTSFVVITTDASEQMGLIHDRMPVILTSNEQINGWLDPAASWSNTVQPMMVPYSKIRVENLNPQLRFPI